MTFGVTRQFVTPVEEDRDSVAPTFWYDSVGLPIAFAMTTFGGLRTSALNNVAESVPRLAGPLLQLHSANRMVVGGTGFHHDPRQ
jgi:hypothetical protein